MAKTILKESAIVILLIISICLLLIIAFYDYIPTSKVVPANIVAYKVENEIQEEINNSTINSTQNIIKTYRIEETDLSVYETTNRYDKGKENPFAVSKSYETNSNTTNTTNEVYSGK